MFDSWNSWFCPLLSLIGQIHDWLRVCLLRATAFVSRCARRCSAIAAPALSAELARVPSPPLPLIALSPAYSQHVSGTPKFLFQLRRRAVGSLCQRRRGLVPHLLQEEVLCDRFQLAIIIQPHSGATMPSRVFGNRKHSQFSLPYDQRNIWVPH